MYLQVLGEQPTPGMVVGIDEAGKGCVLGSLVVGAVFWPSDDPPVKGLRDSKVLPPKRRARLFQELVSVCPCVTVSIHASEIKPGNILDLQMAATKLILRRFRPRRAVIDCPHATPAKFVDILGFPDIDMVAEHKADHRYKPASGGSIIAKVMRDTKLARLASRLGADLGSGYPHDAKTRAWLESLVDRPDDTDASREVRWGWSTCKDIFGKTRVEQELGKERTDG